MSREPRFHSFDDCLPEDDSRAYDTLYCQDCRQIVHASNNETMRAWFDTGIGPVCLACVYKRHESEIDPTTNQWLYDDLALPEEGKQ